jgi:TRAP-type mannitol/chloroaromatic compound transport system permease large subunit
MLLLLWLLLLLRLLLVVVVGVLVVYAYTLADKMLGFNTMSRLAQQVIMVLIPPLALIFLVLGTIFIGLATPTEAGAMGAVGALIMAFLKHRLSGDVLRQSLASTVRLSSFVMFMFMSPASSIGLESGHATPESG